MPRISIITPCLNRVDFISGAIESVLAQNFPDFEHIIMDGRSTDGTLEALKRYQHLKVVSESDQGMYDAINKGLAIAGGDVIGFLNSDDLYAGIVFADVVANFQDDGVHAMAGGAIIFREMPSGKKEVLQEFSPLGSNLLELVTLGSPFFNAWFFRRSVFEKIGKLNCNYRIIADREFMLRFALSGLKYATTNDLVYQYRRHEGAMTFDVTDQKLERIVSEHIQMANAYLRQPDLPHRARQLIRKAHTQDTLEVAAHAIRNKKLGTVLSCLAAGTRHDPAWVLKLGQRALKKSLVTSHAHQMN